VNQAGSQTIVDERFRTENIMDYDWRAFALRELGGRFPREANGYQAWSTLVKELLIVRTDDDLYARCQLAERNFFRAAAASKQQYKRTCIFISHQRQDTRLAKRIACLAKHRGLDFWLDVYDPRLALANRLPAHDPRRTLLIAAIIEIALLNATHVIALHTSNSGGSKWLPYELGRAKTHVVFSPQAAGWFQPGQTAANCGDYVQLALMLTAGEKSVTDWMDKIPGSSAAAAVLGPCRAHRTHPLP
jgi:hypothetical protein